MKITNDVKENLKLKLLNICKIMSTDVTRAMKKNKLSLDEIKLIKQYESISKFRTGIFFE